MLNVAHARNGWTWKWKTMQRAEHETAQWSSSSRELHTAGETGDPRENPQTSDIAPHDPYTRISWGDPAGNRTRFASIGDYSPPTKANWVRCPAGSHLIASGNRAGRCRWSAGFLGDLPAGMQGSEENGRSRENPPTSDIVCYNPQERYVGMSPPEIEPGSPKWEEGVLCFILLA
ncbi:hypothetical protein PR048_012490 [Dryococelus australis]|uniref:Uncharacterized protein n=1 Tax=Dryococelus australis TaxID=614101 RepID=A0ABQ9HQC8_9NEOP|nr:hypothetical protein PR048_012490 [Dryococelus australis]